MATPACPPPAAEEPRRGASRPGRRRSWQTVFRRPLRNGYGIWLEPAGPVPGAVPGSRTAGPLLAVAVAALAAAQYATGRPVAVAWLAIAPLLASLVLRPPRTALLAGWTVLLGLGLALHGARPSRPAEFQLSVLVLLAVFAVVNSALRNAAQRRLGQARAVARVAQSALLREVPRSVAAARLASRYLSASAEARVGGDVVEVIADGHQPTVAGRRHPGQGAGRGPARQRRRDELPGRLRPAGPVAGRGRPGGRRVGDAGSGRGGLRHRGVR